MKKALKIIGIILLVLVVAFLGIGLFAKKDFTLERSIVINAPKELVFEQMSNYKNWQYWSPWHELDTNMTLSYQGEEGAPGSGYAWVGNKDVGEGNMHTTAIDGTEMEYETHFIKPFESIANGYLKAIDTAGGQTKAVWGFKSHMPFPMNAFTVFMNFEKMVGKDFEHGLDLLKIRAESLAKGGSGYIDVQEVSFPATTYATFRKSLSWSEMDAFFKNSYTVLGKALDSNISGSPVGIYYQWDEKNGTADLAAGFPVKSKGTLPAGAAYVDAPASQAYKATLNGPYSGIEALHIAIDKKVNAAGKKPGLVIEEYVVNDYSEKDSTKWVTNIYYLLQ